MEVSKNKINVYTTSSGAELNISAPSTKQVISATNNRAQFYAEQAKKYRDEAKLHRDNAKYYLEQNSDVTYEYINNVRASLENKISTKQEKGDYALKNEIPTSVGQLENNLDYTQKEYVDSQIDAIMLPSQEGNIGKFLMANGNKGVWKNITTFQLFDTKISDYILEGESAKGWALQGTYVSGALYPDFYAKCLEEYNEATNIETVNGVTVKVNSNGHKFYDIADKTSIDEFYNSLGSAWFYGIDTENERIFLPRDKYFAVTGVAPVIGNGMALGLTDGTRSGSACGHTIVAGAGGASQAIINGEFKQLGATGSLTGLLNAYGVTTDPTKSGIEAHLESNEDKYLYICVGNTVINESQIDAGGLVAQMEQKANIFLDNILPSQSFKTQITSWIIPDYSAGIVPSSGFVCPTDGLIHIVTWYSSGTYWVKINDIQVYQFVSGSGHMAINLELNVSKGDVITFALPTLKYEFDVIHFYPLKGAN